MINLEHIGQLVSKSGFGEVLIVAFVDMKESEVGRNENGHPAERERLYSFQKAR